MEVSLIAQDLIAWTQRLCSRRRARDLRTQGRPLPVPARRRPARVPRPPRGPTPPTQLALGPPARRRLSAPPSAATARRLTPARLTKTSSASGAQRRGIAVAKPPRSASRAPIQRPVRVHRRDRVTARSLPTKTALAAHPGRLLHDPGLTTPGRSRFVQHPPWIGAAAAIRGNGAALFRRLRQRRP